MNIVESIAKENFKFTKFMSSIKEYFTKVNMSLSDFKYRDLETEKLPTPTDLIDLKEITADPETIKEYFTEIEPSEIIARTILNECYKLYHNIETLLNYISQNDPLDKDNESAIAKLQQDLEVMKSNWQDALKTSENWKNWLSNNKTSFNLVHLSLFFFFFFLYFPANTDLTTVVSKETISRETL